MQAIRRAQVQNRPQAGSSTRSKTRLQLALTGAHPSPRPRVNPRMSLSPPARGFLRFALPLLLAGLPLRAHEPAADMLAASSAFLGSLSPDQASKATYKLTDRERENWNFIPTPRAGLPLAAMSPAQQDLALALLRTGLSHAGTARAEAIMAMENVLKELEHGSGPVRDPTRYFVTIFGSPAANASWGWRFEGHHLSFNFTVVDGAHVFFTPSFIGSNPAEVRSGPKQGLRVLGQEEDLGLALVNSLDPAQRREATLSASAPGEIVSGNRPRLDPLAPAGLPAAKMTAPQREQLLALVRLYLGRERAELAAASLAEIETAGVEKIHFAWAGVTDRSAGHYYRLQGPTFLCEFDNTQNNANHIHTVWRDFKNDFGRDPLAEHYAREHAR